MLTLGSYTTGRELAGAGFCARFEAALAADASAPNAKPFGKRFLATAIAPSVIAPWLPRAGIDEEARRLVGAARDQAQLVGAGAKRWSIIADFGLLDEGRGAFVVRPTQPWTVERLALARYDIASVELRGIVLGVVEGLIELEKFSARPWGNLNAATVMLTVGPGESRLADGSAVVLTDLESRERLPEDANLDDLRALGRLIYEMVLHKRPPLKASTGWSATWSDGWESVGDGRFWFALANRLMTAGTAIGRASGEIARPPSLSQLRQEVLEHKPFKPLPKRQLMIAGAAAAILALSAGGYFVFRTPPRDAVVLSADQLAEAARLAKWQGLIDRWYGYFGSLYAEREKITALAAAQPATSTIRSIADLLHDPAMRDPRQIAGSSAGLLDLRDRPGDAIGGEKIIAASATLDKIDEVRARLVAWPELANLASVKQTWEARGWGAAAGRFLDVSRSVSSAVPSITEKRADRAEAATDAGSAAEAERSRPPAPDNGAVVRAVIEAQTLLAAVGEIDGRYDAIQKMASDAKARGDGVLSRLGEILDAETKAAAGKAADGGGGGGGAEAKPDPAAAMAALSATTAAIAKAAGEAVAFDSGAVAGWDRSGFRASEAVKKLAAQPVTIQMLDAWLVEARKSEYARVEAPDPRESALAAARSAVEEARSQRERLAGLAAANRELTMQPAELDARLRSVEDEIKALEATAWSNRNRAEVERRCRELANASTSLARDAGDAVTTGTVPLAEALRLLNRSEFSSPTLARVWGAAIDRSQAARSKREAFAGLRETREALIAIDRAAPARLAPPETARALQGFDDNAWDGAVRAAREAAFARALADAPIGSRPDADRVALVSAATNQWRADANQYLEACVRAREAMLRGEELADPALAAAAAVVELSPVSVELGRVLPVISDGVLAMRAIEREADPVRVASLLKNTIAAPTDASVSLSMAAWGRLAQGGWPRDAAEFEEASRLVSRDLPGLIEARVESGSRSRVSERMRARGGDLWVAFMNSRRGAERAAIDAAMRDAGLFGVDPEAAALNKPVLNKPAMYNARLWQLSRRAAELASNAGSGSVAALAEQTRAAGDLLTRVRSAAGELGVAETAAAKGLMTRLDVIAKREARPPFDPLANGPATMRSASGRAIWRGTRQGEAVVYTLESGAVRLAAPVQMVFLPVEIQGEDGPIATYVLTGEVSVGLFIALAESTDSWPQLAGSREGQRALYWWDFDQGDPRAGPAPWQWDRRRAKVVLSERPAGKNWLVGDESMAKNSYYPEALKDLPPPTLASPMNDISPEAALLAARLAGARLPSVAEWKAAVTSAGGMEAVTKGANRRDRTWKLQFDYVNGLEATIRREWPHAGIFWPRGLRPEWAVDGKNLYLNSRDDSALEASDGVLWFASSGHDSSSFVHLVGNVAEFVIEGNADSLAGVDPDFASVRAAVDRTVEKWGVIGGSALSGLTLRGNVAAKLDEAYAIPSLREARMGYSDVGFRLAFSEGGIGRPKEPPAVLAARAFAEAAYLDAK
ncbi:MAG: hypothetical protein K2Y21_06330 [Phycisphaerales bacterium]|nr:hypothetical protein [Phycisphaerales bacterium]